MDSQERVLHKMREIALTHPEKIRIVETNVDADVQLEFYGLMQKAGEDTSAPNLQNLFDKLESSDDFDTKKLLLVDIAATGELEAFRFLEKYLVDCDESIRKWALLACQQCQMFLESSLMDESKIYVASGLGGKEHRLRYIFVLAGVKKEDFTDFHKKIIANEVDYFLKKADSISENLQYDFNYAICTALIPLSEDVVALVQSIIDEVNQYGSFITPSIFITNEKPVNKEMLDKMFDSDEEC